MLDVKHYVGLDLGQVNDYSALVTLRREQEIPELPKPKAVDPRENWIDLLRPPKEQTPPSRYYCNIAERFERGIPPHGYPTLVENVTKLFQDPKFAGQTLVVDGTGVGRPVVDLVRKARVNCRFVPVTITGGAAQALNAPTVDEWGYWHVPKKELVGSVQALLGTGRIEIAPGLKFAGTLTQELKSFSYKISSQTAHVSLESWREKDHDDLVLALALAAWYGERGRQELWVR